MTKGLVIPLSNLNRRLRAPMRATFAAYRDGLQQRRESFDWSEDRRRLAVLHLLRRTLRDAARNTAYYQKLFKDHGFDAESDFTFADFARLPILEREDIHEHGAQMLSSAVPKDSMQKDSTGGSTGAPTEIYLGAIENGWRESGVEFQLELCGVRRGEKMAYFWGHHLDPQANDNLRERLRSAAFNVRWFDSFRLSDEVFGEYHANFGKFAPDAIVAYASAVGQFAEYLANQNSAPFYPRKCVVTGAEKLSAEHRAICEKVFKKPVHERYGGRDVGGLGIQINPQKNLHYWIDWNYALVEPEVENVEYSPILVTKLRADAMPMIRYRVGDLGRFAPNARRGEPAFELLEVVGRELDRILLRDGRQIHGAEIPHLFKDFAVREYRLHQNADFSIDVEIAPRQGFDNAQMNAVNDILHKIFEGLDVRFSQVEAVQRTKANKLRVVSSDAKIIKH